MEETELIFLGACSMLQIRGEHRDPTPAEMTQAVRVAESMRQKVLAIQEARRIMAEAVQLLPPPKTCPEHVPEAEAAPLE